MLITFLGFLQYVSGTGKAKGGKDGGDDQGPERSLVLLKPDGVHR